MHKTSLFGLKAFVATTAYAAFLAAQAENLVPNGDFGEAAENLAPHVKAEAGRVSLFTEHLTWNKCGKCEVTLGVPDGDMTNVVVHAANALIGFGADGKTGFAVEPGVRYDVAFDFMGVDGMTNAVCDIVCWTGPDYWRDRKVVRNVIPGGVNGSGRWQSFRGSFRAPEGVKCAVVRLSVWSSSRWPETRQHKVGDSFLFDNVAVWRSRQNLGGHKPEEIAVRVRKTVVFGETFGDLVSYRDGVTPCEAKTRLRFRRDDGAICLDVSCEEPGEFVLGDVKSPWSGDTIELMVDGLDGRRVRTQVAFNGAGAKYTDADDARVSNDNWELRVEHGEKSWKASVRLPFPFLGITGKERELGVNVGRARPKARTMDVWSPGKAFQDPSGFGRILFSSYADELKRLFGVEATVDGRAAYEARYVELERQRIAEKFARLESAKFSVAPISSLSDFTQPFLPEEIFDPPSSIDLKAAINEIRALPLALANLTERTADYRVVLETCRDEHIGTLGLEGFPPAKVIARKGLRFKDVDTPNPTTRFDPLPRLDEAGSVTVPPHEAGLVWYDFDCTGVEPGVYRGRLRVIPLGEEGAFAKGNAYSGKMQTIPVTLEVLPVEIPVRPNGPAHYFMGVESQAAFDTAFAIGNETFQVGSWAFSYERDAKGDLDTSRPKSPGAIRRTILRHVEFAKRHGFVPRFLVVYSAMDACAGLYGKNDFDRYWPQYVKAVKHEMNAAGIPDSGYAIEVKDEPKPGAETDRTLQACMLAKEAEPTVRLTMLMAAWKPPIEKLREFLPIVDEWYFWRGGYFKSPEYLAFVKDVQKHGQKAFVYSCDVTLRLPLLQYYRQHAWFAERYGLDGTGMYQLCDSLNGGGFGCKDFKSIPYGGLFYRSFGIPVPSVRYMALREGYTDVKFLAALRERNATQEPDAEIAKFLEDAALDVIDRRSADATLPDRLREKARELLAKPR